MLLSVKMLNRVLSVNDWKAVLSVDFTESDATRVYFQLIDLTNDGMRYVPASGATLSAILDNIDDDKKLTRSATQAFPTSDPSIWYVSVLATDKIRGTCALRITLVESGVTIRGSLESAVRIYPKGTL